MKGSMGRSMPRVCTYLSCLKWMRDKKGRFESPDETRVGPFGRATARPLRGDPQPWHLGCQHVNRASFVFVFRSFRVARVLGKAERACQRLSC